jgi:hypothetical protein
VTSIFRVEEQAEQDSSVKQAASKALIEFFTTNAVRISDPALVNHVLPSN